MDKLIHERFEDLQFQFLELYPKGFEDEEIAVIVKRFKSSKFEEEVREFFKKENFSQPEIVCSNFVKIISKSPLISLFEKPKLRDAINSMGMYEKDMFSIALYELLYGNTKDGLESLVDILVEYKLAKWTIITLIPYYLKREKEFFIKPTTTKNILKYFEVDNLVYKPKPSYGFYKEYKKFLNSLKKIANKKLPKDNAAFTGFLKISLENDV